MSDEIAKRIDLIAHRWTKATLGPWLWEIGTPHVRAEWPGKPNVSICDVKHPEWHENQRKASEEAGHNAWAIASAPMDIEFLIAEIRSLRETVEILGDTSTMESIRRGEADIAAGRVQDHADVMAELDKEFLDNPDS